MAEVYGYLYSKDIPGVVAAVREKKDDFLAFLGRLSKARIELPLVQVIIGVVYRAVRLIDGLALLVEHHNYLCAASLIRLQIDSIIRLNACRLTDRPQEVARALLADAGLKKVKDRYGNSMTDRYLHEKASEDFPLISKIYEITSSYIHLSHRHLAPPVKEVSANGRRISWAINTDTFKEELSEPEVRSILSSFYGLTDYLFDLCNLILQEGLENN